ncbi:MAG: hypothetical protein WCG20_02250 [bacterium]
MLSSNLQSILTNRLRYLPEITGKAINSIDWPTKVVEIGHKYGLHIDDIEELQTVVLKSMTGLASPADFETNLISATAASPSTIEKLIQDLNHQIFEPIHNFVMTDGKAPDPLAVHGIELEPSAEEIPNAPELVPEPRGPELEIPASPEPVVQKLKPQVPGSFNDFFVNNSTKTNHSMLR